MNGVNKVILLGNLGADPELRVTPGGEAILKMRLATTESYLDKNSTRQEKTEWHQVTVWGKYGESLSKILTKGSSVYIEGGLRTSSYEKDGEKRYRTDIHAQKVILTGGRPSGNPFEGGSKPKGSQHGAEEGHGAGDTFGGGGDDDIPF